mmetsp:Transcript_83583/g.190708  ORF Transcript_83583/g.190708 Transcript_83583/m.190708 type:complete len:604 (-) Transcript_83583:14-1825(-)
MEWQSRSDGFARNPEMGWTGSSMAASHKHMAESVYGIDDWEQRVREAGPMGARRAGMAFSQISWRKNRSPALQNGLQYFHETEINHFDDMLPGVSHEAKIAPSEVIRLVKEHETWQRIQSNVKKRALRQPRNVSSQSGDAFEGIVKVIQELDVKYFERFTEKQLQEVLKVLKIQRMEAGEIVMQKGDPGYDFYILLDGQVLVFGDGDPNGMAHAVLGRGQSFGEKALITNENRNATIQCKTDCVLGTISRGAFHKALERVRYMEDSRVIEFLVSTPPFTMLTRGRCQSICGTFQHILIPAGTQRVWDLSEFFVVMRGEVHMIADVHIASTAPVNRFRRGTSTSLGGESMAGSAASAPQGRYPGDDGSKTVQNVPIQAMHRGYLWGHEFLLGRGGPHKWTPGVKFSNFVLQGVTDCRLLLLDYDSFQALVENDRTFRQHLDEHATIIADQNQSQMAQIAALVAKSDWVKRTGYYMGRIRDSIIRQEPASLSKLESWKAVTKQKGDQVREFERKQKAIGDQWDRAEERAVKFMAEWWIRSMAQSAFSTGKGNVGKQWAREANQASLREERGRALTPNRMTRSLPALEKGADKRKKSRRRQTSQGP